jgi:hypothetical protein
MGASMLRREPTREKYHQATSVRAFRRGGSVATWRHRLVSIHAKVATSPTSPTSANRSIQRSKRSMRPR